MNLNERGLNAPRERRAESPKPTGAEPRARNNGARVPQALAKPLRKACDGAEKRGGGRERGDEATAVAEGRAGAKPPAGGGDADKVGVGAGTRPPSTDTPCSAGLP